MILLVLILLVASLALGIPLHWVALGLATPVAVVLIIRLIEALLHRHP